MLSDVHLGSLFLFIVFFAVLILFLKVLLGEPSKKSKGDARHWRDGTLSVLASLAFVAASYLFVSSHEGPFLGELVPLIIAFFLAIVMAFYLLWQVFKYKRYGLLSPLVMLGVFYIVVSSVERHEKENRITNANFSEKLPAISQAINNGDVVSFKKEIGNYTNDLNEIDHILYSKCKWKKQAGICEVLLRKKLICSFCFDDFIVLGLEEKKNKFTDLIPLINQLVLESEDKETLMKDITQHLTGEKSRIRYHYLQSLIQSIGDKPIMIPLDFLEMYLWYKDPNSEESFLGVAKLIMDNKSHFFKDKNSLNEYKAELKENINRYIENDNDVTPSFLDELNAILK